MKQVIIEMKDMTDSKEIYGHRPNPFIPAFIYSILFMLIVAIGYSCIGKIDIAITAAGMIRPGDTVDGNEFKTEIYIDNADVGRVKLGDEIKYSIAALPNSQYGTVSGEVKKIASDVLVQNGMYSGYYLVEGSIDATELVDRDGNVGKIAAGMQTEVRIVTQRKTIIKYLLEKLNLF